MDCEFVYAKDYEGVTDIKMVKCDLYKDYCGDHCLHVTYRIESEHRVEELDIPRLVLPVNTKRLNIYRSDCCGYNRYIANLGFGGADLRPDKNGACFTIKVVEEKSKEMTLEEIEKKLGHKVKIVNK